ncbi:hypothetical protein MFIFM68171_08004 [Madurella fahalii]|uniref:Fungal N-terminal domain-containing protein n=1 Tax=Madurella fahalii TaxID=1157608 RepID=A0ABQ0GJ51_9PEZI
MDLLSVTASVIAIIQASRALAFAVTALQKLRSAATEFGELLTELATLQDLLDNFREAIEFKEDLENLVTELQTLSATLIDNSSGLNGNGEHKISAVQWRMRYGKQARQLRDRAAVCRNHLSTYVELLGLAQHLQQAKTSMDIRNLIMSSSSAVSNELRGLRSASRQQDALIRSLSGGIDRGFNDVGNELSQAMRQANEQRDSLAMDMQGLIKSSSSALGDDLRLLQSASQRQDLIMHSVATDLARGFKEVAHEITRATHMVNNRLDLFEKHFSSKFALDQMLYDAVELMLDMGFNPQFADMIGQSAVMVVKKHLLDRPVLPGKLRILQRIIDTDEHPAEISTMIRDALLVKSSAKLTLDQALVAEAAHINELDDIGYAPLHWAVIRDRVEAVEMLIQHGATINTRSRDHGVVPLHLAKSGVVAALLLQHGADMKSKALYDGLMPLHCFAYNGCLGPLKVLLEAGVDPNAEDNVRATPLHVASVAILTATDCFCEPASTGGNWRASPGVTLGQSSEYRSTICHLIKAGADVNKAGRDGLPPVVAAASVFNMAALRQLLEHGPRLDLVDKHGRGILHYVIRWCSLEAIASLSALGLQEFDPDVPDTHGDPPLDLFGLRIRGKLVGFHWQTAQALVFEVSVLIDEDDVWFDEFPDDEELACYDITSLFEPGSGERQKDELDLLEQDAEDDGDFYDALEYPVS